MLCFPCVVCCQIGIHGQEAGSWLTTVMPIELLCDYKEEIAKKTKKIIKTTVPNNFGLNKAEWQKFLKYQDLKKDLRTSWELDEIVIILFMVVAAGLAKTYLQAYHKLIPEIPLTALKGTLTIIKPSVILKFNHCCIY